MKPTTLTILVCGLILSSATAQTPFSPEVDSLIFRGIDQTFASEFDSALVTFQNVIDRYPDHIVGYFYQAATIQSKMMDYETDEWEEIFYRLVDKAILLGEQQLQNGDKNPWTYFYLGSVYSYKGLYQARTGGLIPGFLSARRGVGYLKRTVEEDASFYDAYLGIGSYMYWSGRFYKYLQWLPWIRDERDKGIRLINLSIERGTFSYWVGINSLAWIEYDRMQYGTALRLFQEGLERYPGSRFFLWGVADTQFRLGNYDEAVRTYEEILTSIQNGLLNNGYNEAVCRFKLIRSHFAHDEYEQALRQCDTILERKVDEEIAERLKKRYELTRNYRQECLKMLGRK